MGEILKHRAAVVINGVVIGKEDAMVADITAYNENKYQVEELKEKGLEGERSFR